MGTAGRETGMQEIFSSGHVADLILLIMLLEAGLVLAFGRGRLGVRARGYIANLVAGGGLVVAFRLASTDGSWLLMAGALLVSMIGHVVDIVDRLRARPDVASMR